MNKRLLALPLTSLGLALSAPAVAQDQAASAPAPAAAEAAPALVQPQALTAEEAAQVAAGTAIYGPDGVQIGTVAQIEGDIVVLSVGERSVPLPRSALGKTDKGVAIGITRTDLVAQFDAQQAEYQAKLDAAITTGAAVKTADGQDLGTIESTTDQGVVLATADGPLTLPANLLALDAQGTLIARATLEQINQARAGTAG